MGLILDSSILIAAERKGRNARQALIDISAQVGITDIGISVVTLLELAHGAVRADTLERREKREQFLRELQIAIPVYPIGVSLALRAGRLDGENTAKGARVALADLLIGITALELGYDVATHNLRHFRMIPGLIVISL